jgi:ABC-type nitrate/sulfonate/bicarbonate transport system substrate-binding protein
MTPDVNTLGSSLRERSASEEGDVARLTRRVLGVPTVVVLAAALVTVGCTPAPAATASPTAAASAATSVPSAPDGSAAPSAPASAADLVIPKPAGDLAFSFGHSQVDVNDLPTKITVDRLNSQGWKIDLPEFSAIDLLNQALAQGTVKMTNGSLVDPLRAFQNQAKVGWVMENNLGEYVFVTRTSIPDCKALGDKPYGMQGETSSSSLAGKNWLIQTCGVTPKTVIIPGGDNRVVALLNGQLDATVLQLADWITLQSKSADFKVLDTGNTFTTISGSAFWINRDWQDANPDVAVAFLAEQLKTFRMIHEDPTLLETAITTSLPDYPKDQTKATVEAYLNQIGAWPVNGGDNHMVADAIDFFTKEGELKPGLDLTQVASTDALDKALAIVGRVPDQR